MKKIVFSLFIVVSLLSSSCKKYLDIKPYGKAIPKTAEEFSAILHARLNSIDYGMSEELIGNSNDVFDLELFSENFNATLTSPGGSTLPLYIGSRISSLHTRYERLYQVIRDANIIINNMSEGESEEDRNVLGTAYAMRGISYYLLLRDYCEPFQSNDQLGVPLVTQFDMEEQPLRSNYGVISNQVESDLKKSLEVKVTDEIYRFTEDVTKAYLARFYFWIRKWDQTITLSKELLEKYPLLAGESYTSMIQSRNDSKGNVLIRSYLFRSQSPDIVYSNSQMYSQTRPVSKELIDLFEEKESDIRYDLSFDSKRLNKKVLTAKVRTDEMCLMLAEAYAHLGQTDNALLYLNELRSKRIQPYTAYTATNLPVVNTSSLIKVDAEGKSLTPLMQAILNERRKELFGEGDRWYELKRNGRPTFWFANNGLKYETKEFLYTLPLPRVDIELIDGLIQNPGYEI